MKKIPFIPKKIEGRESIMPLKGRPVSEIRFNLDTREISIMYEPAPAYLEVDLTEMTWREIKKLVLKEGGEWVNTKAGVHFLMGI